MLAVHILTPMAMPWLHGWPDIFRHRAYSREPVKRLKCEELLEPPFNEGEHSGHWQVLGEHRWPEFVLFLSDYA